MRADSAIEPALDKRVGGISGATEAADSLIARSDNRLVVPLTDLLSTTSPGPTTPNLDPNCTGSSGLPSSLEGERNDSH